MKILYNLAFIIFGLFYLPYLVVTKRYKYGMKDRFGILPEKIKDIASKNRIIWIHAVSVGEMKAAGILAPLLRKAFPSHKLLFSTVTHTGSKVARTIATGEEGVFYLPIDVSFIVDKVVKQVKPEIFIVLETELWPNLIDSLYRSGAKLALVNGRISNRSYSKYKKGKFFISALLKKFSLILMQSDQDAVRIITLGGQKEKVFVTGNLKFDIPILNFDTKRTELRKKLNLKDEEVLLIAGSTHRGEEKDIAHCFSRLKKEYKNLRLLIAPRHIERTEEIEKLLAKSNLKSVRISTFEIASAPTLSEPRNDKVFNTLIVEPVFILDTIGELRSMYSASDIVFVGGSLVRKGGQNPIEPASLSKPIIFGKYTFNFHDVTKIFLENEAGIEAENKEEFYSAVRFLMDNPRDRKKLGMNAKDAINKNS
ncbi:MAG: 3-deoxy-D-manno-octulosonic acid transferase, partial [Candidatus Omnitrophota bacterium]|nr:3-deoxy-D-manno-octulosonic acid transferase [Candidatus Omnitrophota bacterium]